MCRDCHSTMCRDCNTFVVLVAWFIGVKDWRDVTPAFLKDELRSVLGAGRSVDMKKLYLPYWVARFTDHVNGVS